MADFADDAAEVTEMNLQVALQNARGWHALTRLQVCAGSVINRYRWARFVMLIVEIITSGERYKAGKEKPLNGALFNYNPRHSLNFQILVFSRQAC